MDDENTKAKILIIDDNKDVHKDFRAILAPGDNYKTLDDMKAAIFGNIEKLPTKNFTIDSAYQGQEALFKVQKALQENDPYSMAFVDCHMPPGWDGIETIKRIWDVQPSLEVVICTAYSYHSWNDISKKLQHLDQLLILKKPFEKIEVYQLAIALTKKFYLTSGNPKTADNNNNSDTDTNKTQNSKQTKKDDYKQLIEEMPVFFSRFKPDGTLTYVNNTYCKYFDLTTDELLGKNIFDFLQEKDRNTLPQILKNLTPDNPVVICEHEIVNKAGDIRWQQWTDRAFFDENGQPYEYQSIGQDITERKTLHEILDRKQKNLEAIFDAAPIGMLLLDEDMTIKRANESIKKMVAKEYQQIVEFLFGQVVGCPNYIQSQKGCGENPQCQKCKIRNAVIQTFQTKQGMHDIEVKPALTINDKTNDIWLSLSTEPVVIDEKNYCLLAVQDICERKFLEEKKKETMEMKSQFISTVSHEIRTPLAAMKDSAQIVADEIIGNLNEKQKYFLDITIRNVKRLEEMINDVLNFQKFESGKMTINLQMTKIEDVLEEVNSTMMFLASKKNVELQFDTANSIPETMLDQSKINQILTNLIGNAIKFTDENGKVTVTTQANREDLIFSVADSGIGIPTNELSRIFERFYRAKQPKDKQIHGTGLGLAIVNKSVMMHNGRIEVESEENKGTTFNIFIPLKTEADCQEEPSSEETDKIIEEKLAKSANT